MGTLLRRCVKVRRAIELSCDVMSGVGPGPRRSCVRWKSTYLKGKGLFLAWFVAFSGIWACIRFNRPNDAEKCIRLVCEKLTVFPYAGIPLNSVSNSFSYDIVRFKIEVGLKRNSRAKTYH